MHILVTGATGFVGARLGKFLLARGHKVRIATRQSVAAEGMTHFACGKIDGATDWAEGLRDIEVVIHLAAPAHRARPPSEDDLRAVNVDGSVNLLRRMHAQGARRMVYLSTAKVYGERSTGRAFAHDDAPQPQGAYAKSKRQAESALTDENSRLHAELVIVRPPLVHGPGAKGNLYRLMRLIRTGAPLPLKSVNNKRSMVGLRNLHDFLETCATHPRAHGVYPVSDGEDLSTPRLIRVLGEEMGCKTRLWPLPPPVLRVAGRAMGCSGLVGRLCDSLQIDASRAVRELNWRPPQSLRDGLREMARDF